MTFPYCDALPRTHEDFMSKKDEDFHVNDTLLVNILNMHVIKSFPLDYMHLVCLGVVHTLFLYMVICTSTFKITTQNN